LNKKIKAATRADDHQKWWCSRFSCCNQRTKYTITAITKKPKKTREQTLKRCIRKFSTKVDIFLVNISLSIQRKEQLH